ncbi:MAG: hypothetical protein E5X63_21120, partial [Mesorhizobium sp.]
MDDEIAKRVDQPAKAFFALLHLPHAVGLLATGMAGLAVHLRARRTQRRTVALLGETAARSRAEV